MTLVITPFTDPAAGVEYFLQGADCCDHLHLSGGEQYFLKGDGTDPKGVWWGAGLQHLELAAGTDVSEEDFRSLYGWLTDPREAREAMREADERIRAEGLEGAAAEALRAAAAASADARLGTKPYKYKTLAERVAARLKKERVDPATDPERAEAIRAEEAAKTQPKARNFYDLTFSPQKSTSLFYAGLLAAGREADAEAMRQIHREAVAEAMEYLQKNAGYARAGSHSAARGGRPSVGRWVDGHEWIAAMWDHSTSREGEPQMHTHVVLLNRVRCEDPDGTFTWRAVDGASLFRVKDAAAAIYERGIEQRMEDRFAVAYRLRPDGKAREIAGISAAERAAVSSRTTQVEAARAELEAEYKERYGQEPNAYWKTCLNRRAAKKTRASKPTFASKAALVQHWQRLVGARLNTTLPAMLERAEAAAIEVRGEGDAERWEPHVVIRAALDRVQEQSSTWTRSDLMFALNEVLPDRLGPAVLAQHGRTWALLEELADQALAGGYGVVMTRGMELLDVPPELRRESDGRSVYRPGHGHDERYALVQHLAAEQYIEEQARTFGAPALSPAAINGALAAAAEAGRPLGEDQAEVVRTVLGSGRRIDTVVGPAGTGKSVAMGVIAKAWEANGGRVIGLAPSSKAAQVLQAEGLKLAINTELFLTRNAGKGKAAEVALFQVRKGDLVILDEAGMVNTEQFVAVAELVEAAGAKLLDCGDHGQLTAVGAGGMFQQLVRRVGACELGTVRRFRNADGSVRAWEAAASMGLREGDVHALQPYFDHGRVRSGTQEEMVAAIRRQYVSNVLLGRHSAVMASTEEQAATIAAGIREDLVTLGKVEAAGVALVDGTTAGVGDLVQARQNQNQLRDSKGMPVYNRFNYRVTARHEDGSLSVRRVVGHGEDGEVFGGTVRLKASYVASQVRLAYAGTLHSEQGSTVHAGLQLVDAHTSREQNYVGMSRGSLENHAFVVVEEGQEALEVLAAALARTGAQESASEALADELDWIESLGAHTPVWADLVEQHQRERHSELLRAGLGEHDYERLQAEDPTTVYRQLWAASQAGHDTEALIAETTQRNMRGAESVPAVLFSRITKAMEKREPEHEVPATWLERTPADLGGPEGELARASAAAMDARVQALGERVAADPPGWAVERLGPVPADPVERSAWQARAAAVEAYRETYHVDAPGTVIGPPPAATMVVQHSAWQAAHQALGRSREEQRLAEMSPAALREQVEIWERELEWAPRDVRQELSANEWRRLELQDELALAATAAEQVDDLAERERLQEQAETARRELETVVGLGQALEQEYNERADWHTRTAELREKAQAALAEGLRRRGDIFADRERDVPAPEAPDRTPAPERDLENGPQEARTLSQQERERDSFARLVERWAGHEREPEPQVAAPAPETEASEVATAREGLARLADSWSERAGQAAEVDAAELRPAVSERVLEELRQAQDRAAEQESARDRTAGGAWLRSAEEPQRDAAAERVESIRAGQEQALAEQAERAAERERAVEVERAHQHSAEINREQHYMQREQAQEHAREQGMELSR